ncbi:MAG: Zn-finger domain associated with topoisomerase type [Pedosphaera sp.]|nr:Zn-finger domain associated with topoisomerase type [Pedosphaera sp.]
MGGVRAGNTSFCNKKCHQNAYVLSVSQQVPPDLLERQVQEAWRGNCPKCQKPGPVDVHKVYEVWSAAVVTRWSTKQQVSCRSCATKRQLGGMGFSLVLGWWGIPWGLILTPVQITRNITAIFGGPSVSYPSAELRKLVQVNLGAQMIAAARQKSVPPPVPSRPPPLPASGK